MGWFGRRHRTPDLGADTDLPVGSVDGTPITHVEWTDRRRRAVEVADRALRMLRAAGVRGVADVRSREADGGPGVEVTLDNGLSLRLAVAPDGLSAYLVTGLDLEGERRVGYLDLSERGPLDGRVALVDLVFAASSLVVLEGARAGVVALGGPPLPSPLTVTDGNVQLLRATPERPERWCVCVFLTREHEVPDVADDQARRELWVTNSVGVKLHLDGTFAADPDDDDPDGERSRQSLATAAGWAGAPVDLLPYARWLFTQTQRRLGLCLDPDLAPEPDPEPDPDLDA